MPETTHDTWELPTLLVFTRNKPEEAVLKTCKDGYAASGPDLTGCMFISPGAPSGCDQLVDS